MENQKDPVTQYIEALRTACEKNGAVPPAQLQPIPDLKLSRETVNELEKIK